MVFLRNFRCDCGNKKFPNFKCKLFSVSWFSLIISYEFPLINQGYLCISVQTVIQETDCCCCCCCCWRVGLWSVMCKCHSLPSCGKTKSKLKKKKQTMLFLSRSALYIVFVWVTVLATVLYRQVTVECSGTNQQWEK